MVAGSKRYSAELKRDAVTLVAELVEQGSTEWAAMGKTADLLGVGSAETVRQWVRKAPTVGVSVAPSPSPSAAAAAEIRRLKKENAELKQANGTLQAASAFSAAEIDRPHRWSCLGCRFDVQCAYRARSAHRPSTYYEHVNRGPSSRMLRDAQVIDAIYALWQQQPLYRVLGARKMWIMLCSNGYDAARCTVERLMSQMGWRGASKKKCPRTTVGSPANPRATDLVDRQFWAATPDRVWVADFTYCRTEVGWVYTAFVIDVFARKIVGWKVAAEMTANLVATAIENAVESRKRSGVIDFTNLVHHSDAGSQYTAITFGQRLAEVRIAASIGSVGDSYEDALAESVNADYKNELVDNGPRFHGLAELSLATAEWVAFYNRERPHSYCQDLTPDHAEALHYDRVRTLNLGEVLTY